MPAEERVVIHVDIDTDLARGQAEIETLFRAIETRAKVAEQKLDRYERKMADIDKTSNRTAKSIRKTDNAFSRLTNTVSKAGHVFAKFLAMFTKFSFIGVAIEIALISTALLSVKLALVSGRWLIKAYQTSLSALGVAAQGVTVVLGSVAAAMRQINEVTLAPTIGGGRQAAQALRGAMNDRQLSFYGMEGIREAVTALAKGGVSTDKGYTGILRRLGDYTADPKQLADLASIYAAAAKGGGVNEEIIGQLGEVNPALVAGIEELTGKGVLGQDVMDALLSGTADATDAWEGQLGRLNDTVLGTLKGMIPRMFQLFADLGQPFLEPIRDAIVRIEDIVRESVFRVRGFVTGFGLDKMIPGFLTLFEKVADWTVKIMAKSQDMGGWVEKMMGWWDTIRNYFIDMARIFQPLEEGADALIEIFKPQLLPIFEGFSMLIRDFADLLVNNKTDFVTFGESIGNVFRAIFDWFNNANEAFADALPVWTDFANMVATDMVPLLGDIFDMMHEASQTILPVVTKALSAVAGALSGIATALTAIMSVPGIGQLLALPVAGMMFKSTRGMMLGAAGLGGLTKGGRANNSLVKALQKAGIGTAVAGTAFGGSLMTGGLGQLAHLPAAAAGSGIRGGIGLAASQLSPLGAGLATAAPGAVLSIPIGTMIGDRVAGAGGMMAGIGTSAAAGASIGAVLGNAIPIPGIGAGLGALFGGTAGAIGGYFSTRSAQQRQEQLGQADQVADRLMKDFYYALNMNLSQGQGLSALHGARTEMEEMLLGVEETAKETGVREQDLRKRLNNERAALDVEIESREDSYKRRLEDLSRITQLTSSDIEAMANATGTDLSNAVEGVTDQMIAIGAIDPWRGTLAGIQDTSATLLYDNLFGGGSLYARETVAPQMLDTLNGLLDDASAQYKATGKVDGELIRQVVDAQMAYTQTNYGLTGMDLAQSMRMDLTRMDAFAGTGQSFQALTPDLMKIVDDFKDPSKNPAMKLLETALLDQEMRKANNPLFKMDEETARRNAAQAFTDQVAMFDPTKNWTGWDESLSAMIQAAEMSIPIDELGLVTTYVVDKMTLLGDNFSSLASVLGLENYPTPGAEGDQPQPADPRNGRNGRQQNRNEATDPFRGTRGGRGGRVRQPATPSTVMPKIVAPVSVSQTTSARYSINVNANGIGMKEALETLRSEIAKAVRNASQRTPRTSTGGGFLQ